MFTKILQALRKEISLKGKGDKVYIITIYNDRTGQLKVHETTNYSRVKAVRKTASHFSIVTYSPADGGISVEEYDAERPENKDYSLSLSY